MMENRNQAILVKRLNK